MSENPEEQPSTGVLGRIGSWLSPWRGKSPKSPSESVSPSDEPDLNLAGEEEKSEECGITTTEEQQKKEESSSVSPSLQPLSRDDLLSKEENATQSSHKDGSAVCSTRSEEGDPKGEELVETRKRRTGQGRKREERRNGTLESGNPEKNASHVTPQFSFSKQGAFCDSALNQPQAQRRRESGKKIHVYLEESVIKRGKGIYTEQEVVRTKVEKSLQFQQPKLSAYVESTEGAGRDETPTNGTESYRCAGEGVSLRLNKDTQFEPETEKKQTEADSMGRKNTARRKSRKSPQREAGSSQRDKTPLNSEQKSHSPDSTVSNEGKSPQAKLVDSSSMPSPTSKLSPEQKQCKTSGADAVKLDELPNTDTASCATPTQAMDGVADMEDDESLYKVERKTETPESKRRSLKMSRSEIKLFSKHVRLNPEKNYLDSNSTLSQIGDEEKSEPSSGIKQKEPVLKKIEEEKKPQVNRIADKISLFEGSAARITSQTFQIPRSADASPVRRPRHKLNEQVLQQEQRSRSAERYEGTRSSSSSSPPLSVEDRIKNFREACTGRSETAVFPSKSAMTGMPQKSTSPVTVAVSKTRGPDILDGKEQLQVSKTLGVLLKPEGPETTALGGGISISKGNTVNNKLEDNVDLQTTNEGEKPCGEVEVPANKPGNFEELTKITSTQSKETTTPISPSGVIKAEFGKNREQVVQVSESTPLPDKLLGSPPIEQTSLESKQNVSVVQDKLEKHLDTLSTEDSMAKPVRREEAEVHVNEDEPDTAADSTRTKAPLDKEAVISPPKEEADGGQRLQFMKEPVDPRKKKEAPSSSNTPAPAQQFKKEEMPPVEHPQLNRDTSADSQQKTGEKDNDNNQVTTLLLQHKDTKSINQTEDQILIADRKEKTENTKGLQQSLMSISVENVRESEGRITLPNDVRNYQQFQTEKDKNKAEAAFALSAEASIPTAEQQHNRDRAATHIQNGRPDGKAMSETQSKKKLMAEVTNLPAQLPCVSLENSVKEATELAVIAGEPQLESIHAEKRGKTPDDSCVHGTNDAPLSVGKPVTEAVKAASGESASAITTQAHKVSDRGSFTGQSTPVSSLQSVSSEGAGHDDDDDRKNTSTGIAVPLLPTVSLAGSSKSIQRLSDEISFGKPLHLPIVDISPIVDKDVPKHPTRNTLKKEILNLPTSPDGKKSPQRSSPRGLSRDDSVAPQDAPSSWLDVDLPVRKLKITPRKLSYSGSESNLLDTSDDLDDEDFVERIKKLCAPFSAPLRKHNTLKPPQPTFAMPAIREDRFEKTFDPEEFTFGLRKPSKYTMDAALSTLAKMQSFETKAGLRPARASLADRSILLSSLDTHSRLKSPDEKDVASEEKEEKEEKVKVKSRLEGSCVFSGLTRAKKKPPGSEVDGAITLVPASLTDAQAQSSPPAHTPASQHLLSSPNGVSPVKATLLVEQGPAPNGGDQVPAVQPVVSDSCPPLPSFDDIKLPDFLEKYRNREPAKPAESTQGNESVKMELSGQKPPQTRTVETEKVVKPGPSPSTSPSFPGSPPTKHQTQAELRHPPAQPPVVLSNNFKKRVAKGFHKRPGKLVLFEKAPFMGQMYEINRDMADATSLQLSPLISIKVVRGCWLLYEKPGFQGRTVALEEGGMELSNLWRDPEQQMEAQNDTTVLIGSIRLVVCDYSMPHIDLFTEPEGHGRVTPYHDDTVETGSFGVPLSTASIQVHSGVWLVFSDPGFQGMLTVLEKGVYPYPESWGFPSPFVGSLRPLKMGVIKVENPNEVKALVYEKPSFEGSCLEIDADVFSFCESEAGFSVASAHADCKNLKSVGSLKVISGFWVGYSEPGFEGQQHILEEGEYLDCRDWGGSEQLLSLQPVLSDFFTPHLKMFRDLAFGERGGNVDLTVPVINMEETGYGMRTQSIDVIGGVWIVFEEPGFCGEPHILERGLYGCPEDWGALQPRVGSAMTVVLDDLESTAKFKVQLFSEPGFQGSVLALENSTASLQDGFSIGSCKVLAGSWLAFEGQDFTGRMYVLEVGSYSDPRAMGCGQANPSILSMQTTGFEFSLPTITLFERSGLRGKRVILTDATVNLQLAGGCTRVQSLLVEGGMWVLYEGINYRGAQVFLRPGEVPDWRELSTWQKIGSLRPLTQMQVHFRIRNRQTGLMMAVTGDLDDIKLMRVQEMEESGDLEQIWFYQNGRLHCKLLEECFLTPSGSIVMAGSRVGLSPEVENHLWSITTEGFICYSPNPGLVLDVKGGHHYDKNQVILNTMDPNKEQQLWDVELL